MKAGLALLSCSCQLFCFTDCSQQICLSKGGSCNLCHPILSTVSFEEDETEIAPISGLSECLRWLLAPLALSVSMLRLGV